MPTDIYGLPTGDINYGAGYGWLPFQNQRDQLLAQLYGMQGGLGQSLLNTLGQYATDPAAGPLGLSAFARYGGGAQNVAAGTNGAGIHNPYGGIFDRLLQGLSQSVMNPGSPFNPDNNGQYNTDAAKIDPNKSPMMTPESAAKAPDGTQEFWKQWPGYSNEQRNTMRNIAGVPGYDTGGAIPVPVPTPVVPPATTADPFAAFGGSALVNAMRQYESTHGAGTGQEFINTIQNIAHMGMSCGQHKLHLLLHLHG